MTLPREYLDAILAQPADDTVRLVCADWWEDHGEPERAEFVRVQCEIFREKAVNKNEPDFDTRAGRAFYIQDLERRANKLLECQWAKEVPRNGSVTFTRGFVSQVNTTLARWSVCIAYARREAVRLGLVGAGVWPDQEIRT